MTDEEKLAWAKLKGIDAWRTPHGGVIGLSRGGEFFLYIDEHFGEWYPIPHKFKPVKVGEYCAHIPLTDEEFMHYLEILDISLL